MTETKYYCDKCKKAVEYKGLYHVEMNIANLVHNHIDLCSTCASKIGFVKRVIKDDKIMDEPQKPTTAEKLYDLMADIVMKCNIPPREF